MSNTIKIEDALYYPEISLRNPNLIKGMALFYDNIYRIVPESLYPDNDHPDLQALIEEGSIGRSLSPKKYVIEASNSFLSNLGTRWRAAALTPDKNDFNIDFTAIHPEKIDYQVQHLFEQIGFEQDDWLHVPTELASNYMLYLAKIMAKKNHLELVTDNWPAWTGTTYFNMDGAIENPVEYDLDYINENPYCLFNLIISEITPLNISDIPAEKIVLFREKRKDEINNLRDHIYAIHKELQQYDADDIKLDKLKKKIEKLEQAKKDYQKSADIIKVKGWTGFATYGLTASMALGNILTLVPSQMMVLFGTSVAVGGVASFGSTKEELKKLKKDSVGSCLFNLEKEFKNVYRKQDINHYAYNCLEEYVND